MSREAVGKPDVDKCQVLIHPVCRGSQDCHNFPLGWAFKFINRNFGVSQFARRNLIRAALATTGIVVVSTPLQATRRPQLPSEVTFNHGVASGDPLQDVVILWTCATPATGTEPTGPTEVTWELYSDPEFKKVLRRGGAETDLARAFTVKIDVQGLQPNTAYYYRFIGASEQSPLGRTKTLPETGVEQVEPAVFSCTN